mmetsp:Transcript_10247/g.12790  ORF Transcript_10247/g.12790 Transcript_10247/m.12790 type:complete len:165 (+) Transcript_10247:226-720(+)
MSIVAISDDTFAVSAGGEEVRIWSRVEKPGETAEQKSRQVWSVMAALNYRDLKVKQLVANVHLRLSNVSSALKKGASSASLCLLHEGGWVSFWSHESWQLAYQFRLNRADTKRVVFESSSRYLAALAENGSVEVWRLKGMDARYDWGLQFKSASHIEANTAIEN